MSEPVTTAPQPAGEAEEAEKSALKQHIGELEQRIAELEAELARTRERRRPPVDWRKAAGPALLLILTLLLAAVPSLLVVQDRWLRSKAAIGFFQNLWCQVKPLCGLAYPAYFALILPCFLVVLLFVLVQTLRVSDSGAAELQRAGEEKSDPSGFGNPKGLHRFFGTGSRQSRASLALFLVSGLGFLAILGRAIASRKVPGWEFVLVILAFWLAWALREGPLGQIAELWQRNGRRWVAVGLLFAAAAAGLASLYATPAFQWTFALLLILALFNLAGYYRAIRPITWIMLLALILYSLNSNAWWLSGIGDEYAFFYQARHIADNESLTAIGSYLFNGQAVYAAHPYLSSLIQAIFMKLFGVNGFAWRFSNAALCAAAVGLFFVFFKAFVSERTALIAALFLAVSHYIMSFGKIGYNNLQALFAMALALAAAAWAARSTRPLAFVLLGAALGFCFYVYPAAFYVLPLPLLLLLFYRPPVSRAALGRWALLIVSWALLIFPLFWQPDYWKTKIAGTFFYTPQLVQTPTNLLGHVARNLLYAFFSFLYTPEEGHFVAVSYVDPLTAGLTWLGFVCTLTFLARRRFAVFLVSGFVVLLLLVGASHDRQFPPDTRMFLLLPWFALFAAFGLTWAIERAGNLGVFRVHTVSVVTVVMVVALGLNLYQGYPLARDRMAGFQSLETLFFRLVQRAQRDENQAPKTYVFITDPSWSSVGIQQLPLIYPVRAKFAEVVVNDRNLPESARPLIANPAALVIIKPWLDQAWQKALEAPLRQLGKVPCPIKTTTGDVRFTLWHSPGLEWLCK